MLIFKFNEDRMKNIETSKRVDSIHVGMGGDIYQTFNIFS